MTEQEREREREKFREFLIDSVAGTFDISKKGLLKDLKVLLPLKRDKCAIKLVSRSKKRCSLLSYLRKCDVVYGLPKNWKHSCARIARSL